MRFRRSLRYRVGLSFALFGALISLLLSASLYLGTQDIENRLVAETLTTELREYTARYQTNPGTPPPNGVAIRAYVAAPGSTHNPPPALRGLMPGFHTARLDNGRDYYVVVADSEGRRFYVLYDHAQTAKREQRFLIFLAGGVVSMTLIAAGIGIWLTGRVISPVSSLASLIQNLRVRKAPSGLAEHFTDDEVGELAAAFDHYVERLQAFVDRERYFTSDVSHELRTPLTVINGAAEVLLADSKLTGRARERVERIARAARDMSELGEALLTLAREEQGRTAVPSSCSVRKVLTDVVDNHAYMLAGKPIDMHVEVEQDVNLPVDRAVMGIVVGNLIRNAIAYTEQGSIVVRLTPEEVVVQDSGRGMRPEEIELVFQRYFKGAGSQGEGIGMSLVKRICDRYGWDITVESQPGQGTTTRLKLHPPVATPATPATGTET